MLFTFAGIYGGVIKGTESGIEFIDDMLDLGGRGGGMLCGSGELRDVIVEEGYCIILFSWNKLGTCFGGSGSKSSAI